MHTHVLVHNSSGPSHFPQLRGYSDGHNFTQNFAVNLVISFLNRKDFNDSDSIKIILARCKKISSILIYKSTKSAKTVSGCVW